MRLVLIILAVVVLSLIMGGFLCGALMKFSEAIRAFFSDDDDREI